MAAQLVEDGETGIVKPLEVVGRRLVELAAVAAPRATYVGVRPETAAATRFSTSVSFTGNKPPFLRSWKTPSFSVETPMPTTKLRFRLVAARH
jgi:hypothetical protein